MVHYGSSSRPAANIFCDCEIGQGTTFPQSCCRATSATPRPKSRTEAALDAAAKAAATPEAPPRGSLGLGHRASLVRRTRMHVRLGACARPRLARLTDRFHEASTGVEALTILQEAARARSTSSFPTYVMPEMGPARHFVGTAQGPARHQVHFVSGLCRGCVWQEPAPRRAVRLPAKTLTVKQLAHRGQGNAGEIEACRPKVGTGVSGVTGDRRLEILPPEGGDPVSG